MRRAIMILLAAAVLVACGGEDGRDDGSSAATTTSTLTTSPSATSTTTSTARAVTTSTAGTPLLSYEEILATYPAEVELCTTEAEVTAQNAEGSLQIEVQGGTLVIDERLVFPCFGMRLATLVEVSLHGTDYSAGSVLVVDPTSDPTALQAGVEIQPAVAVEGEGFGVTVGVTGATWELAADAGLAAIDEFVSPSHSPSPEPGEQGSGPLPELYWGLSEQEALELAAANDLTARVTVRDGQWLPETDEYVSGRLNFIVEDRLVVDGWIEL